MKHARRFVAKILVLVMVFQGWPFFELSREYVYVFPKERVERLLEFITFLIEPASAEAAPPRVVCVPQLPTDLLVPHETWSGRTTILKGVARDEDGNLTGGTYYWDFGDGGQSTPQAITNPDNLAATHTYNADPGTLFIATLHVTDAAGESSEDEYRVLVKDKTLDVEVNKAIDDGLWWLYTQREPVDVYVPIPQTNLVAPDGTPGLKGEYFNNTGMEGDPVLTRIDPVVDFDWGAGSPGSGVNQDRFSARWTGKLRITKPGPYKLAVASDDGVRLYINGQKVIDGWVVHGREWFCHEMNLDAGDHDIMLEFFEFRGSASIGLYWIIPGKEYWRWNNVWYSSTHFGNTTASAVQAFEINGHLETGDPDEDPYVDAVKGALSYLFSGLVSYTIGLQNGNNPDGNGNNIGISWSSNRPIYELGAVMDAIVATGTPDAITRTGGVNVLGRRYQDIVQDMVDMYAWGQGDSNNGGGWRYHWNDWPDNSASQWGAIGMIAAERHFGCIVPQWVKDRNDAWLTYSHDGVGFGYTGPGRGLAQTPSGMIQLSFDGKDITDSRWVASESYLAGVWDEFIRVDRDNRYYSYYAFAKAMRLALPQEVTHLSTGLDWYGDENKGLARVLVDQQNDDGSWPYDEWKVGEKTAAAWNVIILTRTLFEKPPVGVIKAQPNPGAVGQEIFL
ncbi:MAG: hypothetical protein JRJ71_16235, partial [Deltaproteobacteria bacterium]|nr:hypothetical protein [Deltaproteobacteria bacterium]